jgi:23S rRNA pseudouridine2605 synthase
MEERLQKFLANNGIASRRKCEELILGGKVKVNGKVVTELGTKVDPEKDTVEYNGKKVNKVNNKIYILLNKPIGYVTTVKDQFERDTVMDLVKIKERVVPVGRLDMYTSGAILLSNDGEFVNMMTHPSFEITKTYNVTLAGIITEEDVKKLSDGVEIDNNGEKYVTKKALVKILKTDEEKNISRLQITIHEGKNREVRKMIESIGKKVLALHRCRIADIDVKDLSLGKWRYLTDKEVNKLKKMGK